jgi:hypothetical protein
MNNVNLAKHQLLANHQRLYRAIRHARRQKNRQTISQTSQAIQTSHETRDTDPSHPAKVCRQKRNAQTGTSYDTSSTNNSRSCPQPKTPCCEPQRGRLQYLSVLYKTVRRTSQTSDVVATRSPYAQSPRAPSKPTITRHNFQLNAIPANSVFATASTRPDLNLQLPP